MGRLSAFADLDLSGLSHAAAGQALELPVDAIDFDPEQPRRNIDAAALQELADSIKQHGVLQPISVRAHSTKAGRYSVNVGERRLRACRIAGRAMIPVFIDQDVDPYAQVVENLQREDLSPLDLAAFIAKREQSGDTRAVIARRLGKPRSFITETAELIDAPASIRKAHDQGRIKDTRTLYALVRNYRTDPAAVLELLAGDGAITRDRLHRSAGAAPVSNRSAVKAEPLRDARKLKRPAPSGMRVLVAGRKGSIQFAPQPSSTSAEVLFDDGKRGTVKLSLLSVLAWTN